MRYRATDPPVDPFSPGHQLFVNQVSAQGCVVGVDGTKQLVDFRFRVPDAGFEYLSDYVEQLYPPSLAWTSGNGRDGLRLAAVGWTRVSPLRHQASWSGRHSAGPPRATANVYVRTDGLPVRACRQHAFLPALRLDKAKRGASWLVCDRVPEHHRRRPPCGRHRDRSSWRGQGPCSGQGGGKVSARHRPLLRGGFP